MRWASRLRGRGRHCRAARQLPDTWCGPGGCVSQARAATDASFTLHSGGGEPHLTRFLSDQRREQVRRRPGGKAFVDECHEIIHFLIELGKAHVSPTRHGLEETPPDNGAAVGNAGFAQRLLGAVHYVDLVEKNPSRSWVGGQDGRQQRAPATADIHDGARCPEVIGRDQSIALHERATTHRVVEGSARVGVADDVLPERHPVQMVEFGLTRSDGVTQMLPRAPERRVPAKTAQPLTDCG
jgi:hypothetical protein